MTQNRLAIQFGWVSLLQDLGSKMVVPLLPLYLALDLGASALVIGVIDGLGTAASAIVAPLVGKRASGRPPMPLVRLGYGLSSIMKIALAATTGWGQVLVIRVIDRVGKGLRDAPRDAILANAASTRHGSVFGIQQAMDKAGGVMGPLVGLAVYTVSEQSFRSAFTVAFLPCLLSVAVLCAIQPETPTLPTNRTATQWRSIPGRQWAALSVAGVAAFTALPVGLLLLRAIEVDLGVSQTICAFAGLRLATAVAAYPAGLGADRWSPRFLVGIGLTLHALALGIAAFANSMVGVALAFAVFGVSEACSRGPIKAWLVQVGPKDTRAAALGLWSGISGASALASGVVVGAAWGVDGEAVLWVLSGLALIGAFGTIGVSDVQEVGA